MGFFNPFPHDKILDQTNFKVFADDKLNVTKIIISVFDRVENIVGKGEIACTSNFSFPIMFSKGFFPRPVKRSLCWNGLKKEARRGQHQYFQIVYLFKVLNIFQNMSTNKKAIQTFYVLTLSQTTNFRLFQTERVCRRQFQICGKWQKALQTGRKHCGKRRNCSLRAISPFPTVFSKTCPADTNNQGLFGKGLKDRHVTL